MIDDIPPCAFLANDDLHEQELVDSQQPDNSENELDQGQGKQRVEGVSPVSFVRFYLYS